MKNIIKKISTGLLAVAGIAVITAGPMVMPVSADDPGGLQGALEQTQSDDMPTELFGEGSIVTTVINTMLFIVGILSVIMITYAGIRYVTAHGDSKQVGDAKNTLIYAIVGLIISIVAYALVNWVTGLFGD